MATRTLSRTASGCHTFLKWLCLAYYWVYLHHTWGVCKAWSALYDYLDQ